MSYNEAQSIAIAHHQGPMLVLAGPGSGKTHVITNRIANLIDNCKVSPEEILVITFTKYAATEMKERFYKNYKSSVPVTFGTFHGIFYGILRWAYGINGNNILSDYDKKKMVMEIIASEEFEEYIEFDIDAEEDFIENILKQISIVKGEAKPLDQYEAKNLPVEAFRKIFRNYEMQRKKIQKLDFDDMIVQCYNLLKKDPKIRGMWQERYKHILIDEFQDINQMQFETIKLLTGERKNLFIVGDDDQSIYGFRGAKPEIMLGFKKEYPDTKEVLLKTNYRSTQSIVKGASKVIKNNKSRYEKEIGTINEEGSPIHIQEVLDPTQESCYILSEIQKLNKSGISFNDIAIIFRTNADARAMASKLVEYNLPFQMKEHIPNIYDHFIAKNIITYMNMTLGKITRQGILEIINRPNRFIARNALDNSEPTLQAIIDFYKDKDWMQDRIYQLEVDLRVMKNLTPYAFIEYLRKKVNYDGYLCEYAEYRNIKVDELKELLDEIQEQAKSHKTLKDWLDYIDEYKKRLQETNRNKDKTNDGIHLHTMHGSKGLEFKHVFLIQCNEDITPSKKAKMPTEIEEERRMFYVAMTRAKKELTLVYVKQKHGKDMTPSRFVNELLI